MLSSQELLVKQFASVFVKDGEGYALVADKRNFKEKVRDMTYSRSSNGSSFLGEKEDLLTIMIRTSAMLNVVK